MLNPAAESAVQHDRRPQREEAAEEALAGAAEERGANRRGENEHPPEG